MTGIGKFVAVVVGISMFAMPAATMPLHCILTIPSGGDNPHQCHMMAGDSSTDQIKAAPTSLSCCRVSAAKPEAVIAPQAPSSSALTLQPAVRTLLSDLSASRVFHEPANWTAQSPGAPPQAVLCTFLI